MRFKYQVIITRSDVDDAFEAKIPELSACLADGNAAAPLQAVRRVVEEGIETAMKLGRPISEPKGRLRYA